MMNGSAGKMGNRRRLGVEVRRRGIWELIEAPMKGYEDEHPDAREMAPAGNEG